MTSTISQRIWFISLGLGSLLLMILAVVEWRLTDRAINHVINVSTDAFHEELFHHVGDVISKTTPFHSIIINLSKDLMNSVVGDVSTFSTIENEVAPYLFAIISVVPNISQISYFGENGISFSYYVESGHIFLLFSNSSYCSNGSSQNDSSKCCWYYQSINNENRVSYGEAICIADPLKETLNWNLNVLESKNGFYASTTVGSGNQREPLFFLSDVFEFSGPKTHRGAVSLGFKTKLLTNFISNVDIHGGNLYLGTKDGIVVTQIDTPYSELVIKEGTVLLQWKEMNGGHAVDRFVEILCMDTVDNPLTVSDVKIKGRKFNVYCSSFGVVGLRLVLVLAFPNDGFIKIGHGSRNIALLIVSLLLACVAIVSLLSIVLMIRVAGRVVSLSASLIKQMEATRQAERKSLNKSIAFARANHDVRTSLLSIVALIELSQVENVPPSKLKQNFEQMNGYATNLLGILNSVLDTSKIEAGKMQLEEKGFALANTLEEVTDMFYVIALRKGLDVFLDPCDGSFTRCPPVKGDCGKLKQILCNLLSNAVKFTPEGHVLVRSWVKKSTSENSFLTSNNNGLCNFIWQWIFKRGGPYNPLNFQNDVIMHNPDCLEIFFEVEDTGKGIPKENQFSIFENFVQVKESIGEENAGTGLGLGIVQSLVRLMGGDIYIVDKPRGEKGTCFRFNVLLKIDEPSSCVAAKRDAKWCFNQPSKEFPKLPMPIFRTSSNVRGIPFNKSFKQGLHHALLLIPGEEGKRISRKWLESVGLKVKSINRWEDLKCTLDKMKNKCFSNDLNASGKSDSGSVSSFSVKSASYNSNKGEREIFSGAKDAIGNSSFNSSTRDLHKRPSFKGRPSYLLVIIDIGFGYFSEICSILSGFLQALHISRCKCVWLANSTADFKILRNKQVPCDLILQKPLNGSRLNAILGLVKDFGETSERHVIVDNTDLEACNYSEVNSHVEIHQNALHSEPLGSTCISSHNIDKPLSGKTVLIAEDNSVLRQVASIIVSRLGATVECVENGEDVVNLVFTGLQSMRSADNFTYDIILMDCEMPKLDGYEATRRIRIEEKRYGIRIPIIALTAHASSEEMLRSIIAGMDYHLEKPLRENKLLDAIQNIT